MCLWDIGSSEEGSSFSPRIMASLGALTHEPQGTMLTPGTLKEKEVAVRGMQQLKELQIEPEKKIQASTGFKLLTLTLHHFKSN